MTHLSVIILFDLLKETALHVAAQDGRVKAVPLLLDMGASMLRDKEDKTFLDYLIELREIDVVLACIAHER